MPRLKGPLGVAEPLYEPPLSGGDVARNAASAIAGLTKGTRQLPSAVQEGLSSHGGPHGGDIDGDSGFRITHSRPVCL